jgi:dihydroorotase
VTPHHLILTEDLVATYDPIYKVNPPLRTAEDVAALRAALADGTIDAIATDHAPHPREDKDCEWAAAAMGMLGLETALGVAIETMVRPGLLGWRELAQRMSVAPARIGRVPTQGHDLVVGAVANIAVIDPDAVRTVQPSDLASKSGNTPYAGRELPGRVVHTLFAGTPTVRDGSLA